MKTSNGINKIVSSGLIFLFVAVLILPFAQVVYAAALLNKSDTMSTLKASTLSDHVIVFRTPSGAQGGGTPDTITVTFPAGFAMGTFALGNFDIDTSAGGQSNCTAPTYTDRTLAATNGTDTWGLTQSGQVLTFTAPSNGGSAAEAAANACVRFQMGVSAAGGANQITNHATPGNYTIVVSGNAGFGDSGDILISILADDQVAVSATVDETLTFSLGATSVALGVLSASAVSSGSHTVTLATNAAYGLALTYAGTTLTFGTFTIDAMSTAAVSSPGTEQFGINAKLNTTPAVGAECSGTAPIAAAATGYSTVNNYKFVTGETILSAANAVNSTSCTISYIGNIRAITEAGNYTTALTYTATATF